MPTLISRATEHEPPRFDLNRSEEMENFEDGTFVPHLPGMKVGDLVCIDSNIRVSRITAEDARGHQVEFSHELPWAWVD